MFNPNAMITCADAAAEIRVVIGAACLCPHVASMLRDLDKCQGACSGHLRLDIIQGAIAREALDMAETAVLALLN
jgi:hypothetical protein